MDPALSELLRDEEAVEDRVVEAIIRLRRSDAEVPGVQIVSSFGRIATCRLAAGSVHAVRDHPDVVSLKAPRRLGPEYEGEVAERSPATRPTDLRRPTGLTLTGAGVVVGVVDWGMDFDHPNFRARDGTTRLLALWDQRTTPTRPAPQPYGYGTVHTPGRLNRALRTDRPYRTLGYHPGAADRRGGGAHGTHVLDIAAGNGRAGGPTGIAPAAHLVFVHLADRGTGGLANLGDSVRLLEAVDFVARTAGELPWVVNVSVGRHGGPHDGTTLTELAFDELLGAAPGRFIVQSTGNYFLSRTHACGVLSQGQSRTLTFVTDPADTSKNELEIWYDGADELAVRIDPPGDRSGQFVRLGSRAELVVGDEVVGRVYHRAHDPNNGDNMVDAFLSPRGPAGRWTVTIEARRVGSGRFHAWLERDEVCKPCQARFLPDDSDPGCTTGTIANSHLPLVVGAYDAHSRTRPVAPFSSAGPTRDDRWKPDLAGPGANVIAARSAPRGVDRSPGDLVRKSGSSMATPHVAGAVALCLEVAAHQLDAQRIRALVLDTTQPPRSKDPHRLGRGYLDLPRLVAATQAAFPTRRARQEPRSEPKGEAMDAVFTTSMPLALAPARAYRELLYHPGGRVFHMIDRQFQVVGRPGEPVDDPPRPGDVMLQVALGRPDAGACAVLVDSPLTRRRASGAYGAAGWYAAATDAASDGDPMTIRVLDWSRCVPPGRLLLRPRSPDPLDQEPVEHDFAEDDAEDRTPVPVDAAAAVPPFSAGERASVRTPLLTTAESARAVAWSNRVHPATSGVILDEIRGALTSYVDAAAVQAAIGATSATTDAVLVECVHQFQVKCYLDSREHDGQAGESTLDSLGLIARSGTGPHGADRGHANAQKRLNDRDPELRRLTAREFCAANWFERMADPSVFGLRTKWGHGLHVVLLRKLRQAERHLLTLPAFAGKTPAALGTALGISEKHGGARPTQTGSTSVHTLGLAIDIAYTANPWLRRTASWEALKRAARLVSGTALTQGSAPAYFSSLGSDPARSTGQVWDEMQRRNAELIAYFALGTDPTALTAALAARLALGTPGLVGDGESLDGAGRRWRTRIREDRQALAVGDFRTHEPPGSGFLTHARDLVIALRDHGCLAWGAVDLGPRARGSGDVMHFDARIDGAGRLLTENTQAFLPTVGHPCLARTASASPDAEEDDAEFWPPAHVRNAWLAWANLFPEVHDLKDVHIFDIGQAPAKAIRDSTFSAWTNSPVAIYVAKAAGAGLDYWLAVLYHESLHVRQFHRDGGKPPSTYATMVRYECDAYTESGRWVAAHASAAVKAHAAEMNSAAKMFRDQIKEVETATTNSGERDKRYRKFLLDNKLLPPHGSLKDLYHPSGTLRNPDAAESAESDPAIDAETGVEPETEVDAALDVESAPDKAKATIRAQASSLGTDEAAVLAVLRGLTPAQMAELSGDGSVVDVLRNELSGAELAAVGAQLARGRVGDMTRADIDRIVASPARHGFGTLAAAIARGVLLGHHEAFDRTGTGTIHGSQCGTPQPAATTTSDCTEYVKDVLSRTFAAKGRATAWADVLREATTQSGRPGLKGTEVMRALQSISNWEALFWAPDPRNPADSNQTHPFAYKIVREQGTYYGITVDRAKSVIHYRRTNAASANDLTMVERLRRLQFGVLAARGGDHMAMVVNGRVYEVHRSSAATDRNAVEATPLETFAWLSGAIAAPPGDLALAWRTP